MINKSAFSEKPVWVRFSIHITMTGSKLDYVLTAFEEVIQNVDERKKDYTYSSSTNEFTHNNSTKDEWNYLKDWIKAVIYF